MFWQQKKIAGSFCKASVHHISRIWKLPWISIHGCIGLFSWIGYLRIKPMVTSHSKFTLGKRLLDTCGQSVKFGHSIFSWFAESFFILFILFLNLQKAQKSNHCFQVSKPLPQAKKTNTHTHTKSQQQTSATQTSARVASFPGYKSA